LLAYTRYAEKSTVHSPQSKVYYGLSLLTFAGGLMSKPMVVTLPFVLLLLDYWPLARFSPPGSIRTALKLVVEKLPFFALALAGSIITYRVQQSGGAFWSSEVLPLPLRLENALMVYSRYLSKIFWPVDLALIYPYPHRWPAILLLSAALMLAAWSALFLWRARRNPHLLTGWLWFLGTLVPTIGLVQVGVQSMADRYLYLPGIGLFLAVAWGLNDFAQWLPPARKMVMLAGMAALAGCLVVTRVQLSCWQNSLTVLRHTVNVTTDNYAACNLLGNVLEKAGRKDQALQLYEESVRLQPDFPMGQFNLGMLLLETGQPAAASNHLAIAARLMPRHAEVQYDLGLFLRRYGSPADAIDRFRAALAARPDFPGALNDLAWILATAPDPKLRSGAEAVRLAERACALTQNRQAGYLTTLAAACAETGRYDDAIATIQTAAELARAAGQKEIVAQDDELLKSFRAQRALRKSF
jgi:protein O-mannosyl-transferase